MKASNITVLVLLFCLLMLNSFYTQTVNEFQISGTDNSPSTFIQDSPKLFAESSARFLTTWKDSRNGEISTYAQWFDSTGSPVGKNFEIFDDDGIAFTRSGSFLCTHDYIGSYMPPDESAYHLKGKIYNPDNNSTLSFPIYTIPLGMMDVDPLGVDYQCIGKENSFVVFLRVSGLLGIIRYDLQGNVLPDKFSGTPKTYGTMTLAAASAKNDNYILCRFDGREAITAADTVPMGIYATIFTPDDSISTDVLIKEYSPSDKRHYGPHNSPIIKCISLEYNMWKIFWLDREDNTLSYATINSKGDLLNGITTMTFPDASGKTLKDFSITPISNENKFAVYILYEGYIPEFGLTTHFNVQLNFNSYGGLLNQLTEYSPAAPAQNDIFYISDNSFFSISENNNDIFLTKVKDFSTIESQKINDDLSGGNEVSPIIKNMDHNNFFISWKDEIKNYGIVMDGNGNATSEKMEFKGNNFLFLANGNCYNFWRTDTIVGDLPFTNLGYLIYNKNWGKIGEDTLVTNGSQNIQGIAAINLTDSLYIICYTNNDKLFLRLIDFEGKLLKENHVNFNINYTFRLYRVDNNSFFISWSNKLQYFNKELEHISSITNLFFDAYIGNNKFLRIQREEWYANYNGSILNTSGEIEKTFVIAKNVYPDDEGKAIYIFRLPEEGFIAVYKTNENIYACTYSSEGIAKTNPFIIHSNTNSNKKFPTVSINKDKVLFAWSDNRNQGSGYDIYGSLFDLPKIVNVEKTPAFPSNFSLLQNYPNPFNPTTVISYQLPVTSHVTLKVYDILGNEIKTLVNEIKAPGDYNIRFDAGNLSAGIYFYRLTAGNFSAVKKLMLIK